MNIIEKVQILYEISLQHDLIINNKLAKIMGYDIVYTSNGIFTILYNETPIGTVWLMGFSNSKGIKFFDYANGVCWYIFGLFSGETYEYIQFMDNKQFRIHQEQDEFFNLSTIQNIPMNYEDYLKIENIHRKLKKGFSIQVYI